MRDGTGDRDALASLKGTTFSRKQYQTSGGDRDASPSQDDNIRDGKGDREALPTLDGNILMASPSQDDNTRQAAGIGRHYLL